MSFLYHEVRIEKSEHTTLNVVVPEWEIPVLAAVHGHDVTHPTGETRIVNRAKPDAETEFARLVGRYKSSDGGESPAEAVYGLGQRGIAELAKAIAASPEQAALEEVQSGDLGELFDEPVADDPTAGLFDAPIAAAGARPIEE